MEQNKEGVNILALMQYRFNETYLQVTDLKMVGEIGSEVADYPHVFQVLQTYASGSMIGIRNFHIKVNVYNGIWGPLFGYTGSFTAEWVTINDGEVPADLVPVRYE